MNVINPTDPIHEIKIIPRFNPSGDLFLDLLNEETKASQTIEFKIIEYSLLLQNGDFILLQDGTYFVNNTESPYYFIDGYLIMNFSLNILEGQKFQIKITENNEVVYRGKLMATSQNTQNFKASKDLYYYE
jgi:hypothetical protein